MPTTHRPSLSDGHDLSYAERSRSQSMSSDRTSLSGFATLNSPPPSVNPEPAYIAPSAAAQIVTTKHQDHVQDWFDEVGTQPPGETALVASASLMLVNSFLDHLLYNFLFTAKSTSLASLRPAVSEVLRPRLATEAIAGADQELQEFLGGGDDEELSVFHNGQEPGADCDMELVWKRTRLRCMVYTRLGDMEEEEEDMWVERECLEDGDGIHRPFSKDSGVVSPAVAIFLTSVLEFIGEHALMVAGEAAYLRLLKSAKDPTQSVHLSSGPAGRLIVEELDMEKVAFNTTLGRLWRTWRKRIRSPVFISSRNLSRDSTFQRSYSGPLSNPTSRKSSFGTADDFVAHSSNVPRSQPAEVVEEPDPASIPLPMTEDDVQEIESPVNPPRDDSEYGVAGRLISQPKKRPRSMLVFPSSLVDLPMSDSTRPRSQNGLPTWYPAAASSHSRHRSCSLPHRKDAPKMSSKDSGSEPPHTDRSNDTAGPEPAKLSRQASSQKSNVEQSSLDRVPAAAGSTETPLPATSVGRDVPLIGRKGSSKADRNRGRIELVNEEPQIMRLTRISMDGSHSPVEVVQTRSRAGSSTRSFKNSESSQLRRTASQENQWSNAARSPTSQYRGGVDMTQSSDVSTISAASPSSLSVNRHGDSSDDLNDEAGYFGTQSTPQEDMRYQSMGAKHRDSVDDEAATSERRTARFVFPAPIPSPSQRTFGMSTLLGKDSDADNVHMTSKRDSPTSSLHRGSPALTTLRELTEDVPESSHEVKPDGLRLKTQKEQQNLPFERTRGIHHHRQDSHSSGKSVNTKHMSNGSKSLDLRNEYHGLQAETSNGLGVIRSGSSPKVSPIESSTSRSPRSYSSGGDKQSPLVSEPGTPQATNKINGYRERQNGATERHMSSQRPHSEGSASMTSERHSQTASRPDDKQRSFEQLIRSDETIQYTLTPQNMRDMESPDSSRWVQSRSTDVIDVTRDLSQKKKDLSRPTTGRSVSSKSARQTDARTGSSHQEPAAVRTTTAVKNKSPANPPAQSTNIRRGVATARDARIEEESVRDLADFIRSTGPETGVRSVPRTTNSRPTTASRVPAPVEAGPSLNARPSDLSPKRPGKSSVMDPVVATGKARSPVSTRSGPRPQAREPTVSHSTTSSDLIDFIRQGPPHDREEGTHRIPRTVAPFRSTMDSDEIDTGLARESVTSTQDGSVAKSLRSSLNSRTALLETSNRANGSGYTDTRKSSYTHNDERPRPPRKQRRVRDPYAIDTDSEEELHVGSSSMNKRGEESLMDFLNNVPAPVTPPPEETTFDDTPSPKSKSTLRKGSVPNLKTRLTRPGSTSNQNHTIRSDSGGNNIPPTRVAINPPQLPTLRPRATSDGPLSHLDPKGDQQKPTHPTYVSQVNRERTSKRPTGSLQARSGRVNTERSSELADFLRNSSPPVPSQTYAPEPTREDRGFTRMFSRRKKSAGLVH